MYICELKRIVMRTIGDIISDIKSVLNAENIDQHISSRFIFNTLIDEAYSLMKQKANLKNLYLNNDMIKFEQCVETVLDDGGCCGVSDKVIRTKNKIEALIIGNGSGIISVSNADNSKDYPLVGSFVEASRGLKMRFGSSIGKAIYNDGYIYIIGASPKLLNITYLKSPNELIESLEKDLEGCESIYDKKMPIPEDLITYVKKAALEFIFTRFKITEDENPNLDSNIRSKDNTNV